jgi:hypothetical protein
MQVLVYGLPRTPLLGRWVNKAFRTGAIPGAKAHKGAGLRGRGEGLRPAPSQWRHYSLYGVEGVERIGQATYLRIDQSAHLRRRVLGGWTGATYADLRDYVVHSRGRIRRGAATTLLGPYPAIGPSRALHGLPGGAPRAEVGRRGAVGPSQYPDSRVDSIQAVARGKPLRISFPTPQGARTPSFSDGAGKAKGGYPRPGIGERSSLQAWEVRAHRSYG